MRRFTLVLVVAVLALGPGDALAERLLGLAQLAGGNGCIAQPESDADGTAGCARGKGLVDATQAVVTPDGRSVYVAASGSSAVAAFARDAPTGKLREANCVSANGTNGFDGTKGACGDGDALSGASAVDVSPDGKNVYAAAYGSGGIAVFSRNPATGAIRQTGCVRSVKTCVGMRALAGAASVAVSPDGLNVYLASADADAVVSFKRDPATGALAPLGCVSDDGTDRLCATGNALRGAYAIVVAPDGKNVYVAAYSSNAVLTFERDPATGTLTQRGCVLDEAPGHGSCIRGHALSSPVALDLSADGRTLFAAASESNAVVVFARDLSTGAIREVGCVSEPYDEDRSDGCAHVSPLESPTDVAVSPNGAALYVTQYAGITIFRRDTTTGVLGKTGCVTYRGYYDEDLAAACTLASGVASPSSVTTSRDGRNVYVTSYDSDAIATFTGGVSVAAPSALMARRLLSVRVGCPEDHLGACSGRVVVTPPPALRRLRQSRPYRLDPGRSGLVHLRLRPALVAAARRAPLRAIVSVSDGSGTLSPVKRLVVLRARRAPAKPSRR